MCYHSLHQNSRFFHHVSAEFSNQKIIRKTDKTAALKVKIKTHLWDIQYYVEVCVCKRRGMKKNKASNFRIVFYRDVF